MGGYTVYPFPFGQLKIEYQGSAVTALARTAELVRSEGRTPLTDLVFQQIVEMMKANRERDRPKSVRFFVTNSMMMMSVRYAIPSQFYGSIQLEPAEKGVLKDAAGL